MSSLFLGLLNVAQSLSLNPLVFATGFPKTPILLWISAFSILAFRSPQWKRWRKWKWNTVFFKTWHSRRT